MQKSCWGNYGKRIDFHLISMKKYFLSSLFLICLLNSKAQTTNDSVIVSLDTINIHGKVIDERGEPVTNATILSESFDKDYNYLITNSDNKGEFRLEGIKAADVIRVRTPTMAIEKHVNGSRFLLIQMLPREILKMNNDPVRFDISANRIYPKDKYSYKTKDTTIYYGFHPFGYLKNAEFPGGIGKFYEFIKHHIKYPQRAIKKNIEGMVKIQFTIDNTGNYKNFIILQDIGYGCAQEVIKIVKTSRKWIPGQNGSVVEQTFTLDIPFKLLD